MKVSLSLDNQTAIKPADDQPWQASDTKLAVLLDEMEATFLVLNRGRYLPYPTLAFVDSLQRFWEISNLEIEGLDLFRESVVY